MLSAILGIIGTVVTTIVTVVGGIIELLPGERPCESLANLALVVVGIWLLWRGANFVGMAFRGFALFINVTVNAVFTFTGSLLRVFGTAIGGLLCLLLGGVAIWCAFALIGGG